MKSNISDVSKAYPWARFLISSFCFLCVFENAYYWWGEETYTLDSLTCQVVPETQRQP